jgi:hypothetical protein
MQSVLISITLGALLGGIVRAMVDSYQHHRESRGIALALHAEIRALRQLIGQRAIPEGVAKTIALLEDDGRAIEARDVFGIRVTDDYFAVFRAVTQKIGFLGDLSGDVVFFYSLAKAVVEELVDMRQRRDRMADARVPAEQRVVDRAELLDRARELRDLLTAAVAGSETLLAKLEQFHARRWMGVLR